MTDGAMLILETAVFVDDNRFAMLHCPIGAESPYEPTSCSFFNAKGLRDTLASVGFAIEHEEYLLRIPQGVPAPSERLPIDRCALVCRKVAQHQDPDTQTYWSGTPDAHTQPLWNKRASGTAG